MITVEDRSTLKWISPISKMYGISTRTVLDWPEAFIMSYWQITAWAMSWTGDMQGNLMRKMVRSKEKRQEVGRPVGGGLKLDGKYWRKGYLLLEGVSVQILLTPSWVNWVSWGVKCRDTTACMWHVYWPSWHNVCVSISRWPCFCQSCFNLWKEYRRKVVTVIQMCDHC